SSNGLGGALAGAGAGASNTIEIGIHASVNGGSVVTAMAREVDVSASDESVIHATAIGAALAVGASGGGNGVAISVGISIAVEKIANDVLAEIDASTADAGGGVKLNAEEDAQVHAVTVAPSVAIAASKENALSLSGGGAAAINSILSHANAAVTGSTITAHGSFALDARSTSLIEAT